MLEFLGPIASTASSVMQLIDAFKGPKRPKTPKSEKYAIGLLKALAEPGNPLIDLLTKEELQNYAGMFQEQIRSKVLADRRERSLGRAPVFFDPERFDENIAFQISRGMPRLRQMSQQSAIERIMKAAGGVGGFAPAEYGRQQDYQAAIGASKEGLMGSGGITGLLNNVLKPLQNRYTPQDFFSMLGKPTIPGQKQEDIIWNQMRY